MEVFDDYAKLAGFDTVSILCAATLVSSSLLWSLASAY